MVLNGREVLEAKRENPLPAVKRTAINRTLELLVWLIASLPVLLVKYAPYNDLPSHLARFEILQRLEDPFYSAYWISNWAPLPNLGADLLILGFALVTPTVLAMKFGLVVIVAIFGSGFARLHEAWSGHRSLYALLGYPLAYGMPLTMGFLNYVMGIGLTLWTIAIHLRLREAPLSRYALAVVPLAAVTALTHMVAFAQLMLILGLLEFGGINVDRRVSLRNVPWARLASLAVLPTILLLITPKGKSGNLVYEENYLARKIEWFRGAFQTGLAGVDKLFFFGLIAALVLLAISGLRWTRSVKILLVSLLVLYMATPYALHTMYHLDTRQPWVVITLALALVTPMTVPSVSTSLGHSQRRAGKAVIGLLGILFLVRTGALVRSHVRRSAALERLGSEVFAKIPEGSLLFTSHGGYISWSPNLWEPPLIHAASLALFSSRVYPNTIFAILGQQPLAVRPEFSILQEVPSFKEPRFPARGIHQYQILRSGLPPEWRSKPAYVFFVGEGEEALPGPGATLVAHEGMWGLYRLPPPPSGPAIDRERKNLVEFLATH